MSNINKIDSAGDIPPRQPYKVLVRTDNAGRVTAINSSAFVRDITGWTQIDEGYGDKCHHAQGNYLDGPLWDERGVCRYKLEDGQAVERTQEEMDADYTPPTPTLTAEERMDQIEAAMMELAAILEGGALTPTKRMQSLDCAAVPATDAMSEAGETTGGDA